MSDAQQALAHSKHAQRRMAGRIPKNGGAGRGQGRKPWVNVVGAVEDKTAMTPEEEALAKEEDDRKRKRIAEDEAFEAQKKAVEAQKKLKKEEEEEEERKVFFFPPAFRARAR